LVTVKRVFLTLVLLVILSLILVTGLLLAGTLSCVFLAPILTGAVIFISMPLSGRISMLLSTRRLE